MAIDPEKITPHHLDQIGLQLRNGRSEDYYWDPQELRIIPPHEIIKMLASLDENDKEQQAKKAWFMAEVKNLKATGRIVEFRQIGNIYRFSVVPEHCLAQLKSGEAKIVYQGGVYPIVKRSNESEVIATCDTFSVTAAEFGQLLVELDLAVK